MALEIQTIIDIILVTLAYCVSVLVVPNIVFHEMLREKSLTHRFIVCTVLGNVYLVNIVFLIFLLHIPGKLSLYLFTSFRFLSFGRESTVRESDVSFRSFL